MGDSTGMDLSNNTNCHCDWCTYVETPHRKGDRVMSDLISRQPEQRTLTEDDYAYCTECDHVEMCRWYPMYGCEFKSRPSAQPEPQWIPCSERLPDEDHWTGSNFQYSADVLMTVYNAGDEETIIDYGHTTDGKWYSDTTDCYVPSEWEVTAWMPLPEPYNPT